MKYTSQLDAELTIVLCFLPPLSSARYRPGLGHDTSCRRQELLNKDGDTAALCEEGQIKGALGRSPSIVLDESKEGHSHSNCSAGSHPAVCCAVLECCD